MQEKTNWQLSHAEMSFTSFRLTKSMHDQYKQYAMCLCIAQMQK